MTAMFPGWHPTIVHFPLALVVTAAFFFVAARLIRQERHAATFAIVGTWNLCLGAAAAVGALATGFAAVLDLHVGAAAHQAISLHLKWAVLTSLLLLLLGVWRGAGSAQESRPSWGFLVVLLVATASLIVTGYRGGQNVYRYAIGVHGSVVPSFKLVVDPDADSARTHDVFDSIARIVVPSIQGTRRCNPEHVGEVAAEGPDVPGLAE